LFDDEVLRGVGDGNAETMTDRSALMLAFDRSGLDVW
jgi:hypothetical protein